MKSGPKIICLRRKVLAAVGCAVAAVLMCWVTTSSKVVGAAATERQMPIYCVQKDYKVLSIGFDATWVMAECGSSDANGLRGFECIPSLVGGVLITLIQSSCKSKSYRSWKSMTGSFCKLS